MVIMQEEKEKMLGELGLSKNETKVYLALLELGLSALKAITTKSGIHRSNVYDTLKRLAKKGLVSHVSKDNKTYYEATDPECLMSFLKEKENKLKDILPQLRLANELAPNKGEAHLYEGVPAVRNILSHFLDLKKPRYVYGVPKIASDLIGEFFLKRYHDRRVKLKLEMKHIYNSDAKERINLLNKKAYTESRYLPEEYDSHVATSICGDEVVLILYSKKPLIIQITNADIAKAYKKYFDLLWNLAKKE